jgi:hypothetical protein
MLHWHGWVCLPHAHASAHADVARTRDDTSTRRPISVHQPPDLARIHVCVSILEYVYIRFQPPGVTCAMPCVRMYVCIHTHTHTHTHTHRAHLAPSPFSSHFCHTRPPFPASLLSGATFCEHRTRSPRSCRGGEGNTRARWRVCTSLAPCSLLLLLPRSRQGCLCLLLLLSLSATVVVSVCYCCCLCLLLLLSLSATVVVCVCYCCCLCLLLLLSLSLVAVCYGCYCDRAKVVSFLPSSLF